MCAWLVKSADARGVASVLRSRFERLAFSVTDGHSDGMPIVAVFATSARFGNSAPIGPAEADDVARELYAVAQSTTTREVQVLVLASDSSARTYGPRDLGWELAGELGLALAESAAPVARTDPGATIRLVATISLDGEDKAVLKLSGTRGSSEGIEDVAELYVRYIDELLRGYPAEPQTASILEYAQWAATQLLRAAKRRTGGGTRGGDFEQALDYGPVRDATLVGMTISLGDNGVAIDCPSGREAHCLPLALCLLTIALCSPQLPTTLPAEVGSRLRQLLEERMRPPQGNN